jgi:hypothetical protein
MQNWLRKKWCLGWCGGGLICGMWKRATLLCSNSNLFIPKPTSLSPLSLSYHIHKNDMLQEQWQGATSPSTPPFWYEGRCPHPHGLHRTLWLSAVVTSNAVLYPQGELVFFPPSYLADLPTFITHTGIASHTAATSRATSPPLALGMLFSFFSDSLADLNLHTWHHHHLNHPLAAMRLQLQPRQLTTIPRSNLAGAAARSGRRGAEAATATATHRRWGRRGGGGGRDGSNEVAVVRTAGTTTTTIISIISCI